MDRIDTGPDPFAPCQMLNDHKFADLRLEPGLVQTTLVEEGGVLLQFDLELFQGSVAIENGCLVFEPKPMRIDEVRENYDGRRTGNVVWAFGTIQTGTREVPLTVFRHSNCSRLQLPS